MLRPKNRQLTRHLVCLSQNFSRNFSSQPLDKDEFPSKQQNPKLSLIRSVLQENHGISRHAIRQYYIKDASFYAHQKDVLFQTYVNGLSESSSQISIPITDLLENNVPKFIAESSNLQCFGLHLIDRFTDTIFVAQTIVDALAIYSSTGIPAIVIMNQNFNFLEKLGFVKNIFAWFQAGYEQDAFNVADSLGMFRTKVVLSHRNGEGPMSPLEAFKDGLDLIEVAKNGGKNLNVKSFSANDIFDSAWNQFSSLSNMPGVPLKSLPSYNKILKGLRQGELTIFTGPTGSGKTTVLSQISLDFCSGIPTLWGSFEIRNTTLINKMLRQYSKGNLPNDPIKYKSVFEEFQSRMPINFMGFYGSTPFTAVKNAIYKAVEEKGIKHVVLDNLQFMVSDQHNGSVDRYALFDSIIGRIRDLASTLNIHVTLVIHPRKEEDNEPLKISSIHGTAKASQEADNIIILQRLPNTTYLDIKKNRFDGTLGKIDYEFDPKSLRVYLIFLN
ncbi:P-loop containing nucleoside triphosphate hydrolase protein [Rozella allomycis CSF55]|uniref:P-loop containing nucleoside triphosphate hydrolase protein n=1 Tax=Rozella allomycis (strain CSF55) TaxID=988480 RepID=A0A4P9YPN5_ROZAC|nr:P-loop containing nucleoside triphosphate hydrolase protein [Rozella allomycis CSF55]